MFLSVIIPCYNEKNIKEHVDTVCGFLDKADYIPDYEIIVVNDGSRVFGYEPVSDKVRTISYEKNCGKGYAVKTGFGAAKGDCVLFMDCDLSTELSAIETAVEGIRENDIVIGNRYNADSNSKRTFVRWFVSKCLNLLEKMVLHINVEDTQCGFKMFTKTAAAELIKHQKIDGFAFDLEYLYLAKKMGYKIKDIPVLWHENDDESSVNLKKSLRFVTDIFVIRKLYKKSR